MFQGMEYQGSGSGKLELVLPDGSRRFLAEASNTWVYEWAHIVMTLAFTANPAYRPSYLYVEYQNLSDPTTTIAPPVIDRAAGLSYYLSLASTSNTDFLRIPATLISVGRDDTYIGTQSLASGLVNQLIVQALTAGSSGINGKPFSSANNSKIYGLALVATPVVADITQDLVWGRVYYPPSEQVVAPATGSILVTYRLTGK